MKKIVCGLLLTILLVATFLCPISVSADSDDWVLGPDAAYLTHGDKTYYPIEFPHYSYLNYGEYWDTHTLEFEREQDERSYFEAYVDIIPGAEDIIVEVTLSKDSYYGEIECIYYVEEAYQDEFVKIKDGISARYCTENSYASSTITLEAKQYNAWKQGSVVEMAAKDLVHYDVYFIYACDIKDIFRHECGIILRGANGFYLLDYSEYDRTYFYADGEFAVDHDGPVKVYLLENEELQKKLIECYDAVPEEELDWLVPPEPSEGTTTIVSIIFFGVLPGAIMVFAVIMLILVKKRQYRIPFIILLCSAAMVLVAFILLSGYVTLDPLSINYSPLLF